MVKNNKKIVWYIHPYCGGPNIGHAFRPYDFSKQFSKQNITPIIISPDFHHLMYDKSRRLKNQVINDVNYYFIKSNKYKGNGIKRIINMLMFPFKLLLNKDLKNNYIPSVIIVSSPHLFSFLGAYYLAKKFKAKLILEVRDIWPLSLINIVGVSKYHPLIIILTAIEKMAYRKSDYIVTLLKNAGPHFAKYGINPEKVHYIPNGAIIQEKFNYMDKDEIVSFINNKKNNQNFIIGYTGSHGTPNALGQLLKACLVLKKHKLGRHFHLIMIGDGTEKESLQLYVNENNLDNIHFFDTISRERVRGIISHFDICYHGTQKNDIYKYGSSQNKLFEYMSLSKPILSSMHLDSIVDEANCGIIAECDNPKDLAKKIEICLSMNDNKLKSMGNNGFIYLNEKHNIKKLSIKYMELFK